MPEIHVVIDSTANIPAVDLAQHSPDFPAVHRRLYDGIGTLIRAGHEVLVITLAEALSGTAQGARTAAQMLNSHNIYIIDSGTTAIGIIHLAQAALTMADSGSTAAAIAARLQAMARVTHTLFAPATLEYLYKGGRIGGAAALVGSILQIKPVLHLVGGKVAVVDKVRTRGRAIERMLAELARYDRLARIGIVETGASAEAEALSRRIGELYPYSDITISGIGSVLAAHLGPGLIGLIFQEEL
ncbi:EDD domain protein, DegV family [Dendrosporobacter quercicolus]|uniref:EDD domain protein, DegV family n=2 Tax=Dendrosporobacter quercicolus TaxID=146817 RepID=A0A1G9TN50_9FIRM|nr:EDD domain protein, DegV family [Dendrosporobacter quercicolus]